MCSHCDEAEMHGKLAEHHKGLAVEAGKQGEWDEEKHHSAKHKHHLAQHHKHKQAAKEEHEGAKEE